MSWRPDFEFRGTQVTLATFSGGAPALTRRAIGAGQAFYCGFLPGLAYFFPAVPRRPADRGCTDLNDNQ